MNTPFTRGSVTGLSIVASISNPMARPMALRCFYIHRGSVGIKTVDSGQDPRLYGAEMDCGRKSAASAERLDASLRESESVEGLNGLVSSAFRSATTSLDISSIHLHRLGVYGAVMKARYLERDSELIDPVSWRLKSISVFKVRAKRSTPNVISLTARRYGSDGGPFHPSVDTDRVDWDAEVRSYGSSPVPEILTR